jgi:hypothetical protein
MSIAKCGSFRHAPKTIPVLLGLVLLAGTALPLHAQDVGRLRQISGSSPFANCNADHVGKQPGTNYPDTEIEPQIASNPTDTRNLIVGWQQDRWSNGGARGLVAGFTKDGRTWLSTPIPNITLCTGGRYQRASDPWVDIGPTGTAYFMSLATDADLSSGAFGANAMLVSRSRDGGATWGNPKILKKDPSGQILNDKNSLTADPRDPDLAYAVWDRLRDFTLPPSNASAGAPAGSVKASAGAADGVLAARERAKQLSELAKAGRQPTQVFFQGPAFFTRTTNGGDSWEPIRKIYDPGGNAQTINNLVVVPPSGTVFDFFTEISPNGGTRIGFLRSLDKGQSFRGPRYATTIATTFGSITPDTQELVREAALLVDVTVDRNHGNLYLVWQDVRFSGVDEVAFSMSTDGGQTWSRPVRINQTPRDPKNILRQQAIIPSVEVGAGGKLVVTYYDYRFETNERREATDYWAVFCDPKSLDCRKRENWGVELRLSNRSFDIRHAPEAGGYFLGDYMGLARAGSRVYPAFGMADGNNITDIFTRPIELRSNTTTAAE